MHHFKQAWLIPTVLILMYYFRSQFCLIPVQQSNAHFASPKSPLPPVHINSSWIGMQWIPPPGYRLFNAREIQAYFQHHSVLFVGDSTGRRSYASLFAILSSTEPEDIPVVNMDHPSVIDLGKIGHEGPPCSKEEILLCREMPNHASNRFDFAYKSCLKGLGEWAKNESSPLWSDWVNDYTLIIFVLGPWEVMEKYECNSNFYGRKNNTDNLFQKLFQADDNLEDAMKTTSFVWRTWGSHANEVGNIGIDRTNWDKARTHNDYVKMLVDKHDISRKNTGKVNGRISYLDWGQVMLPRLYPNEKRISGDIAAHYGLEARVTFLQMLMNHLMERDRQKALKIHPFLPMGSADNHGYNDTQHFMTISKANTQEEIDALEIAKLSFCGNCKWSDGITCSARLMFIMGKAKNSKHVSEIDYIIALKENRPACNNSAIRNATVE